MDDPNAALPSDPTVDESYTKGSRPARPRTRTSAPANAAGRALPAKRDPATQRPARGRTPQPRARRRAGGERAPASSTPVRLLVPAQARPTPRRRRHLPRC